MSARRRWSAPQVLSRPIAAVEALLAQTYGKQANTWATASAARRASATGGR